MTVRKMMGGAVFSPADNVEQFGFVHLRLSEEWLLYGALRTVKEQRFSSKTTKSHSNAAAVGRARTAAALAERRGELIHSSRCHHQCGMEEENDTIPSNQACPWA